MTKQRKRDSLLQKILLMSKDLYAIKQKALKSCLCVCFGVPSKSCVKCLYIEKE